MVIQKITTNMRTKIINKFEQSRCADTHKHTGFEEEKSSEK